MRDHALKTEVGAVEDQIVAVRLRVQSAATDALRNEATGHAEFYENVTDHLRAAEAATVAAYTLLLNGDEDLGVEPLGDE